MTLQTVLTESTRETPVVRSCDVLVCGGGPAGVAAALAAARAGADTVLLDRNGCLGGVWTAGMMAWIIDPVGKGAIMEEIRSGLEASGAVHPGPTQKPHFGFDVEAMKALLEEKCVSENIEVVLHTMVVGVQVEQGRLTHVITESKSGREAWRSKVFVDATGDGDVGAFANCGFDKGHPDTGAVQPMSLCALLAGIEYEAVKPFVGGGSYPPKVRLLEEMQRAGITPSYKPPIMMRLGGGLYCLIAHHAYAVPCDDARAISRATLEARQELQSIVKTLRQCGEPWENLCLVATGDQIGVREGRRIHGRHTVTIEDMIQGTRHADTACHMHFGLDLHSTDAQQQWGIEQPKGQDGEKIRTKPYDIPLDALVARDVEGLLLAGRCISGDFLSHSSYRVTGGAVGMGESAGRLAAQTAAESSA